MFSELGEERDFLLEYPSVLRTGGSIKFKSLPNVSFSVNF